MTVGAGYTAREVCDGQSPASPGRWPPKEQMFPEGSAWQVVRSRVLSFARKAGTQELLVRLALGQVNADPFRPSEVAALKEDFVHSLAKHRMGLHRCPQDRNNFPADFLGEFGWGWELVSPDFQHFM